MSDPDEGLRAPIHHALTTPLLIAGIPRSACYLLWTVAAAFAFGMQEIWIVPIALVLHLALALHDVRADQERLIRAPADGGVDADLVRVVDPLADHPVELAKLFFAQRLVVVDLCHHRRVAHHFVHVAFATFTDQVP